MSAECDVTKPREMNNTGTVFLDPDQKSPRAQDFEERLTARIVGQERAVRRMSGLYQIFLAGMNPPNRPIGTMLFLGPTGSGKTRVIEAAAEVLYGDPNAIVKIDFLCRDSILAAPIVLDLALFLDLAQRAGMKGVQEWLSFYFKSPQTAPGLYPEHDIFIQLMKLKNTLRHLRGEDLITHLGLEYYD